MARDDDETLPEAFWAVARRLRRLNRDTLAPLDVSPSHGRALGVLARHGTMRLSALSEHLRIAPRSTTEVVDALQERGLAERRPDPEDRRATQVTLTEHGRDVAAAIRSGQAAEADAFFGTLSESDRTRLMTILRKLRG